MPFRKIVIKVVSDSFLYLLPKWVLQETALVAGSSPLIRLPPASARPLGLLPLGVSAPWTFATLFTFLLACIWWLTKRACPLKQIFLEVANPLKLMIGHCNALDSYITVPTSLDMVPMIDTETQWMVNTEVIKMGKMPSIPYRFVQLFHNPVAKVMLCQTQE